MKILYFSAMPLPIENILSGKTHIEGFPAYFHPMYRLMTKGHEVDFILLSNYMGTYDVKVNWFNSKQIIAHIKMPYSEKKGLYRIVRKAFRSIQALIQLYRATGRVKYDFIYAHGSISALAQVVAKIRGIPVGIRWYGDSHFCYSDIVKVGTLRAAVRHPLDWLNFKLPYAFFLITDDHSYGDKVYASWKKANPPGEFYFWKTGIEIKSVDQCSCDIAVPVDKYIFYAGRFARWKRQDRAIETLHLLHSQNVKLHLYFAGQTSGGASSLGYIEELKGLITKYGLNDYVHFLGAVSQETLKVWAYNSVATLIMHDIANIGNIFYEIMSVGAVTIVTDDGSVRQFINHGENGYIVSGPEGAVDVITMLLDSPDMVSTIKRGAEMTAREKFQTADERFDRELSLIEDVVAKRHNRW